MQCSSSESSVNDVSSGSGVSSGSRLREGFKLSKWKFKMFFSMKGAGSRVPHTYCEKLSFSKNISNHSLTVITCFALREAIVSEKCCFFEHCSKGL